MANQVIETTAQVVEIGADGDGKPSVTLEVDGAELLLRLKSIEQCRAFAPALCREVPVTITVCIPEVDRG